MDLVTSLKVLSSNPLDENAIDVVEKYVWAIVKRVNYVAKAIGKEAKVERIEIGDKEGLVASYDYTKKSIIISPKGALSKISRFGILGLEETIAHEVGHSLQEKLRSSLKESYKKSEEAYETIEKNLSVSIENIEHTTKLLEIDINSLKYLIQNFSDDESKIKEISATFENLIKWLAEYKAYIVKFREDWLYIMPNYNKREAFKHNLRIITNKTSELAKELTKQVEGLHFNTKEAEDFGNEVIKGKKGIARLSEELINYLEDTIPLREGIDESLFYISFNKSVLDAYADLFMLYYMIVAYGERGKQFFFFSPYFSKSRKIPAVVSYIKSNNIVYLKKELYKVLNVGLSKEELSKLLKRYLREFKILNKESKEKEKELESAKKFGEMISRLEKEEKIDEEILSITVSNVFKFYNLLFKELHESTHPLEEIRRKIRELLSRSSSEETIKEIIKLLIEADDIAGKLYEKADKELTEKARLKLGAAEKDYAEYTKILKEIYYSMDKISYDKLTSMMKKLYNVVK
jgi:adenosyl cobinamide kinase/adenosyl cobinamide phosphate guanylyltransferase